jgi:hypothetical protein
VEEKMQDDQVSIQSAMNAFNRLLSVASQVQADLDNLDQVIDSIDQIIDSEWATLESAVDDLLKKMQTSQQDLQSEWDSVGIEYDNLSLENKKFESGVGHMFSNTDSVLVTFTQSLPQIASNGKQAWNVSQQKLTTVTTWLTDTQATLTQIFSNLQNIMSTQIDSGLSELIVEIDNQILALGSQIRDETIIEIVNSQNHVSQMLDQVHQTLITQLKQNDHELKREINLHQQSLDTDHTSKVDNLMRTGKEIYASLNDIGDQVSEVFTNTKRMLNVLEESSELANSGLNTAIRVFKEAKRILDRFN